MGQLIDSSVLIQMERRGLGLEALIADQPDEATALAAITVSEILAGVYRADSPERRLRRQEFLETLLEEITVEPFDVEAARTYAQLWAKLTSTGQRIGAHDLMIAATALALGYTVLTGKLRDFQRVPGLTVQQPGW